ncbi:MAG: hypothetical protein PHP45_00700 [Elusimicrobiales bacterium]|nr:hypothetical protein [Elusimicrobiales bacterium]
MVFALLPTWRRRGYYILCAAIWGIAVFKEFSDVSQQALDWEAFHKAYKFGVGELKAGRTIFIHCKWGRERTGTLAAAFLIRANACNGQRLRKEAMWARITADNEKADLQPEYKPLKNAMHD